MFKDIMLLTIPFFISFLSFLIPSSLAANTWAGSNLYYAAGLSTAEQDSLFSALQSAGVKVLRVWLDGESSGQKGTTFTSYSSLEPNTVGTYDDQVLNLLDDVMYNAATNYGIKLLISMYSFNSLNAGDAYSKAYTVDGFYTNSAAISAFENRIWHILYHVNPHNGKQWLDCNDYIFAFEAQNEAFSVDVSISLLCQCTRFHPPFKPQNKCP